MRGSQARTYSHPEPSQARSVSPRQTILKPYDTLRLEPQRQGQIAFRAFEHIGHHTGLRAKRCLAADDHVAGVPTCPASARLNATRNIRINSSVRQLHRVAFHPGFRVNISWSTSKSHVKRKSSFQQPSPKSIARLFLCAWLMILQFSREVEAADGPLPGLNASAGFWADVDNDGLMDVLLTGAATVETTTRLYRNNGDGTFHDLEAGLTPLGSAVAAWGDYNNDGELDLVIAGQNSLGRAVTQIYKNEGNGIFTNIEAALEGVNPTIVQWLDFDNDGDIDLYISGLSQDTQTTVSKLYRNEHGTFLTQSIRPKELRQGIWGDFDGDGDLDLISQGGIQRNDGDGRFRIVERSDLSTPRYGSLAADYDGDGDLDVAAVGDLVAWLVAILQNDGVAGFQPLQQNLPIFPDVVRWGDFNGDDNLDLLIAGHYKINVYERTSEAWNQLLGLLGIYFGGLNHTDWVDFDGDGDLDVFYTGPQEGNYVTGFHTNTLASSLVQIGIPTNLRAIDNGDEIRLQWDSPQIPAKGLTYNVRIGTSPGGIEIVAPHASLASGRRWLHAPGNAAIWNRHRIRLPFGRYYWSVQAINAAYVGGMFANEGTFEITNSRPIISEFADRKTAVNVPTPLIPFTVSDAETPAADLITSASSSDTNVVPADGLLFDGTGSNRTLRVFPAVGATGQVTIVVTVRDPQGAESDSRFDLAFLPQFSLSQAAIPKVTNPILVWGDMDRDNDLELIVGGTNPTGRPVTINGQVYIIYDGVLSVFRKNESGTLVDSGIFILGVDLFPIHVRGLRYGTISLNDLEGDGYIDLLITGEYAAPYFVSDIYRNSGDGTFVPLGLGYPHYQFRSYNAWEDFNQDGRPDIMMGGRLATRLYRNLGESSFGALTNLPGHFKGSASWLDYDNDGDSDLVLIVPDFSANLNEFFSDPPDRAHLYQNDGIGKLADTGVSLPNLEWSSVAPADYDGDGWLDFVLSGSTDNTDRGATTQLYHNEQGSFFRRVEAPFVPVYAAVLSWADYDNDGDWDLLIAGTGTNGVGLTRLYRNEGGGTFVDDPIGLPDLTVPAASWADFDQDGDLDLALGGSGTNGAYCGLFLNNRFASNTPPVAPLGLQTTPLPDNGVLLTWSAGSDFETTNPAALSYAVRVGTNSGGQNIVAALSDSITGFRRVAKPGQWHRSLRLPDLPRGDYFWSVQTIDSALDGSPFSVEAHFAITNARPSITNVFDLRTIPNTPATNSALIVGDLETPTSDLVLSATSSDTNLLPVANVFFSGSGSNRTITVLPTSLVGISIVTVTVKDSDDGRRSGTFIVRVDEFSELGSLFPNVNISNFDWGDYDNDGDLDLLAIGTVSGTNVTKLYQNAQDGTFGEVAVELPALGTGIPLWADFDNDGRLDILLSGSIGSRLLRNAGDSGFVDMQLGLPALSGSSAVCFDYDSDGDTDILLTGFESGRGSIARFYRNEGNSIFSSISAAVPRINNGTIVAGDLDNDGDLDLLLSGRVENEERTIVSVLTSFYRNDGNGAFARVMDSLPSIARSAALGDYDNDGDLDVLLNMDNGAAVNDPLFLFSNEGNWTFSRVTTGLPSINRGTVAWGDYNDDGHLDILVTGRFSGFPVSRVYRNIGGNIFADCTIPTYGAMFGAAAWVDFDNDSRLDFAVSGAIFQSPAMPLRLARNLVPSHNRPPSAPTNLNSTVTSGGNVVLSWSVPSGEQAAGSEPWRYNLRLGTTPGGEQIMTPSSDPSTGQRRLARFGNAGSTNSWRLTLRPGIYFWSVQSIDAGFAGSTFAQEHSFAITAPSIIAYSGESPGAFHLRFAGTPGFLYSVMASSNLMTWSSLGPATESAPGVFEFVDEALNSHSRFYRIRSP